MQGYIVFLDMFRRKITQSVIQSLDLFPVVGIIGPRQVGKTTLVKSLATQYQLNTTYLDLERPSDLEKLNDPELYFSFQKDKTIILDEIQIRPSLLNVLRSIVDDELNTNRFIILGSASPDLLAKSADSLAGRIRFLELYPLDWLEVNADVSIQDHWFYGGFPKPVTINDHAQKREWIHAFISTYIERDLNQLGFSTSPQLIRKLWTMIANQQGGIVNSSAFARSLGISAPTVNRYLDFLIHSFTVFYIQPFLPNLNKRLVKSPKIYISDSGILHQLLSIHSMDDLLGHIVVGASWEGYVISQILSCKNPDLIPYFYRTQDGSEVDLVLTRSEKVIACIEIKFSNTPKTKKGLTTAIESLQSRQNFVVTPESDTYPISKNILVCNMSHFLTKILPTL